LTLVLCFNCTKGANHALYLLFCIKTLIDYFKRMQHSRQAGT
jgi:hypothetical protein